ncbi:hypothetical protein [Aquibacillus kalidii]|nr:hypothetical protein [Aquibacillus kalidii]
MIIVFSAVSGQWIHIERLPLDLNIVKKEQDKGGVSNEKFQPI